MRRTQLEALRSSLGGRGVSPAYIRRLIGELEDHCDDLEREELASGRASAHAESLAMERLGCQEVIVTAVLTKPELKSWCQRWPWLVTLIKPFVVVLLVPAMPILACVDRAPSIARWSASISLAAAITGGMLLVMAQTLIFSL